MQNNNNITTMSNFNPHADEYKNTETVKTNNNNVPNISNFNPYADMLKANGKQASNYKDFENFNNVPPNISDLSSYATEELLKKLTSAKLFEHNNNYSSYLNNVPSMSNLNPHADMLMAKGKQASNSKAEVVQENDEYTNTETVKTNNNYIHENYIHETVKTNNNYIQDQEDLNKKNYDNIEKFFNKGENARLVKYNNNYSSLLKDSKSATLIEYNNNYSSYGLESCFQSQHNTNFSVDLNKPDTGKIKINTTQPGQNGNAVQRQ